MLCSRLFFSYSVVLFFVGVCCSFCVSGLFLLVLSCFLLCLACCFSRVGVVVLRLCCFFLRCAADDDDDGEDDDDEMKIAVSSSQRGSRAQFDRSSAGSEVALEEDPRAVERRSSHLHHYLNHSGSMMLRLNDECVVFVFLFLMSVMFLWVFPHPPHPHTHPDLYYRSALFPPSLAFKGSCLCVLETSTMFKGIVR